MLDFKNNITNKNYVSIETTFFIKQNLKKNSQWKKFSLKWEVSPGNPAVRILTTLDGRGEVGTIKNHSIVTVNDSHSVVTALGV